MSDATYWKKQLDILQSSKPKSYGSYYNQSFVDRMNEAQANIDNLVAEKNKSWSATQQKQQEYDTFRGSMSSYDSVYKNAKAEFGIEQASDNYEKSKQALAMTEMAMNALPSSINASSNRVLTQSQRESAYNIGMNKLANVQASQMKSASVYEDVWKNARENATAYSQAEMASQYAKLGDYNNAWIMSMDNYNNAERKWESAKVDKLVLGADYRDWQIRQSTADMAEYISKLNAALSRYNEAMDTDIYQAQLNVDAHNKIQQDIVNEYQDNLVKSMIDNYYTGQQRQMVAKSYDSAGLFGKVAFVANGMKF